MDHHITATATATATATDPFKRKPGRPPKHKHRQEDFGFQVPDEQPPAQFNRHLGAEQGNYSEPIFASLGLGDDGVAPTPPPSAKRGRGRPPKAAAAAAVTFSGGSGSDLRRRKSGRPKRIGGPVTVPLSGNVRGRQPAQNISVVNTADADADAGSVSRGRGRGRPPKTSGGANKIRNLTSQPFGWSNKLQVESGTAVLVTDPHQLVAFQELKLKYEHLQSKAKEVLSVVRPYVMNSDYAVFGAVQELETLVADVSSNV